MIAISIAAAAAQKRVNRPRISAMPPTNSIASAPHTQAIAGSKPMIGEALDVGVRPAGDLAPAVHRRFQPQTMRITGQASGMAKS